MRTVHGQYRRKLKIPKEEVFGQSTTETSPPKAEVKLPTSPLPLPAGIPVKPIPAHPIPLPPIKPIKPVKPKNESKSPNKRKTSTPLKVKLPFKMASQTPQT